MIKLSFLIGKDVLELSSSRIIGRIKNAYFMQDLRRIAYFLVSLKNKDKDLLIPIEEITSFNDAIVVQNSIKLIHANDFDFTSYICDVLNMSVYTPTGILKGQIKEIEFSQNGKTNKFHTSSTMFSPSSVLSVGGVIILKNSSKPLKTQSVAIPRPQNDSMVSILSTPAPEDDLISQSAATVKQANTVALNTAPLAIRISAKTPYFSQNAFNNILGEGKGYTSTFDDIHTPTRVICDYSFLLDRTLQKDVIALNGTVIAKSGERITDEVVSKARREGKLVDLALNSVR